MAYRKASVETLMEETFRKDAVFENPTLEEWTRMKATVTLLLRFLASEESSWEGVRLNASVLGFDLERIEDEAGRRYVVLREQNLRRRGGGVYFFKEGSGKSLRRVLAIQSPHARYDERTGPVGRFLFEGTEGVVFYLNSAPRCADKERALSDVAHNAGSFFQAAHEAFCDFYENALVVQLHGFDNTKKETSRSNYDIILSDGTPSASRKPFVRVMAERFRRIFGKERVALFGDEIDELGATTNVQGKYINQRSDDKFLHVELSPDARERIMKDAALRKQFVEAFLEVDAVMKTPEEASP